MKFNEMYDKPIDRPIDAVVKASSMDKLANELDEYVITGELASHLNRFFDEYNDPDATGNGAWISGFFGSGKSHMLKILAVILQDHRFHRPEYGPQRLWGPLGGLHKGLQPALRLFRRRPAAYSQARIRSRSGRQIRGFQIEGP